MTEAEGISSDCSIVVDRAFLESGGSRLLPPGLPVSVYESASEIDYAHLGGRELAVLLGASLESVLRRLAAAGGWPIRLLGAGAPSARVLGRVVPWSAARSRVVPIAPISSYDEKRARITALEGDLRASGVAEAFIAGISTATDECLSNAIFDASPTLRERERTAEFTLEEPVDLGFEIEDGLVTIVVRDRHGTFDAEAFATAILRQVGGSSPEGERGSGKGLRIGLFRMMRYSSALSVDVVPWRSTTVRMVTDVTGRFGAFLSSGKVLDFRSQARDS